MRTVCVDLDGVLNLYDGWKGPDHWPAPRPGAEQFLIDLCKTYRVVIWTTRPPDAVERWMDEHYLSFHEIAATKPPAWVYIDDRAICFDGSFEGLIDKIDTFKTHWERDKLP